MTYSRASLVLLILEILATSASALRYDVLEAREATTSAVCNRDFAWANNANGKTPCQLASIVAGACHANIYNIPALTNASQKYNGPNPSDNNDDLCTCSWASYNLHSACAACQGVVQAVYVWAEWKKFCSSASLTDDTYFPRNVPLPDDVSLPFWATTNPDDWPGHTWSIQAARSIYNQGTADVGNPPPKKTSSAGPIAGGVIGGLVVLLGAAGIAYYLLRRHRTKMAIANGTIPSDGSNHHRSTSDATNKSGVSMSYTNLSSSPFTGASQSVHTHNTSNYPFSVFGTPNRVSEGPTVNSPPFAHSRQTSGTREEIITPFNVHSSVERSTSTDRKGAINNVPSYDSPDAPPTRAGDALLETPRRNRINPPAYTPHDTPSPPPVASRTGPSTHVKSGSTDTHRTQTSISSNNARQGRVAHSVSNSISDIMTTPLDALSGVPGGTTGTGTEAPSAYPRDVKQRPTDDSLTGRDLA